MLARQHLSAFLFSQLRASVLFLSWFALIVNAHLRTILPLFSTAVQAQKGQGFSKVAFSRACWPLSMVACGDREDFLPFLRIVPSLREGTMRRNGKSRGHTEALPLRDRDFCFEKP